ncbi:MAG: DNA-binding protein, partial [Bacteroidaceae bacterium]
MKYKVVKLIHPSTHETNYCARVVSSFSVTLHDICENISRECSFSVPDVKGLVSALQEEIE